MDSDSMTKQEYVELLKKAIVVKRLKKREEYLAKCRLRYVRHRQEIRDLRKQKHDPLDAFFEYSRELREQKEVEKLEKQIASK